VEPFLKEECLRICSDVTPLHPTERLSGMHEFLFRSFLITIRKLKEPKYPLCDVVIKPDMRDLSFFNYSRPERYFERGYRAAALALGGG